MEGVCFAQMKISLLHLMIIHVLNTVWLMNKIATFQQNLISPNVQYQTTGHLIKKKKSRQYDTRQIVIAFAIEMKIAIQMFAFQK